MVLVGNHNNSATRKAPVMVHGQISRPVHLLVSTVPAMRSPNVSSVRCGRTLPSTTLLMSSATLQSGTRQMQQLAALLHLTPQRLKLLCLVDTASVVMLPAPMLQQ